MFGQIGHMRTTNVTVSWTDLFIPKDNPKVLSKDTKEKKHERFFLMFCMQISQTSTKMRTLAEVDMVSELLIH